MVFKILNNRDIYKRKFTKLKNNPGIFFRDYFNKHYPVANTELGVNEVIETAFVEYSNINTDAMPDDRVIDVVFTWVDNTDEAWQKKYEQYKDSRRNINLDQFATDSARFDNHNELFYSIKAVKKYLPWVRNIYVITDNQVPSWLSKVKGVTIVDHTDIIESKYLPTFNSHVIEAFLHRIPNLSEDFIYFNDDVFFNSVSQVSDCFIDDQVIIYGQWKSNFLIKMKYLFRKFLHHNMAKQQQPKFTAAQMLSADMVGLKRYYALHHRPHFIQKERLQNYFKQHPEVLLQQIGFKFRDFEQFLPVGLANHLSIQHNKAILKPDEQVAYVKPSEDIAEFLQALQNDAIKYGCIQSLDLMTETNQALIRNAMINKFGEFLPQELKSQVIS